MAREHAATREANLERELELVSRTAATLASLDLEQLVQGVTDAGRELSGAQFAAFFYTVTDASGEAFTLYTLSGAPREAFEKFGQPRATPIFAPTFRGEAVIRSGNVREDPRYGQWAPHHGMPPGHLPVCSYLAVPVTLRSGTTIGGLFFGHSEPNVFTERSERLMVGLAAQAAVAIDNARLYEDARRSADAERAARAEIERVGMLKDEFLATLSHELRTPLNAVLGWSEILLSGDVGPQDRRRAIEAIARNARAQAQLIEDLLDMNRIVSGKLRLDVQDVDILAIVEAAVDAVRPAAQAKGTRLRTVLDPDARPGRGDPNRLQQVVWNLLTNALKFTPKGGTVDVSLAHVASHIEIVVTDTGVGIDPQFLPHIFERFRQADSSTTRTHAGLGLGLSIVKHLVELHGGQVAAESPGEGRGATFRVALPFNVLRRSSDRADASSSTLPRVVDVSLANTTVLVVDDDLESRNLLSAVLTGAGAEVLIATSADDALAMMKLRLPDVLVSDIGMPGKDGYDLIREVRQLAPEQGGRVPALAVTAFARSEDRTRSLLAGFQVHIAKPVERHELVVTIASLVGRAGHT